MIAAVEKIKIYCLINQNLTNKTGFDKGKFSVYILVEYTGQGLQWFI